MQVGIQHQVLRQRQYAQLDASSETTGVRYMPGVANPAAVQFRQAVHELPAPDRSSRLQPKILAQVDDPHRIGNRRGFQKFAGVAVADAQHQRIDVGTQLVRKTHIGFAQQVDMHVAQTVAAVAVAVYERQLDIRVI